MGDAVLAFFGAPIAHEDDPAEAVQAGEVRVSSFEGLGAFGALFPPLDPDRIF